MTISKDFFTRTLLYSTSKPLSWSKMNLRKLAVGLMILVILAGNIQVIKGESDESSASSAGKLVPPLNVTFKAKIDHSEDDDNDFNTIMLFNDKVFFDGDHESSVYMIDLNSGKIVWSYEPEAKIIAIQGTPFPWFQVHDNLIIMGVDYTAPPPSGTHVTWTTGSGAVIAVDMTTKDEVWKFPTKHVPFRLRSVDGTLYFAANEEGIYALDVWTGKVKWLYPELPDNMSSTGKMGFNDLLLIGDTIYTTTSGKFLGVDPNTGLGKYNGTLHAIDIYTGKEKFRADTGRPLQNLVFANNVLYGHITEWNKVQNNFNTSLVAFNLSTKHIIWKTLLYPFSYGGMSPAIVTNESIYVTGNSRRTPGDESITRVYVSTVYALSASTGKIKWEVEQNSTREAMVLDEPYLYVLGDKYFLDQKTSFSEIVAYDTRSGENVWSYVMNEKEVNSFMRTGLQCSNGTGRKTIYLAGYENYELENPVQEGVPYGSEYVIYGFSSSSAEPIPELPSTSLILTVSILTLIPILFRKRWKCDNA